MPKNAIIFHGTGGNPQVCWYPWLGMQLESKGYKVTVPFYPTINKEPVADLLPTILADLQFNSETVIVGHSGGAPLILSILEQLTSPVRQVILVAGYITPPNNAQEPVLQASYDWQKIKSNVQDIYFINSTDDPYGCDDKQGRAMLDKLGGTQIILTDGHFGSPTQDYPRFELVNNLIA